MPTSKRRRTFVLPDDMDSVLQRVIDQTRQSFTSLLVELLEPSMPSLRRLAEALETVKQAQAQDMRALGEILDSTEAELRPLAVRAAESFLDFTRKVEELSGRAGCVWPPHY